MTEKKLKAAILGLNTEGLTMLEGAWQTGLFDFCAVADQAPELATEIAKRYDCTPYDDYRQLVMKNQVDVLFVAAPLHLCNEYLRTAMKKKFDIIKLIPPALDFEQFAEFVRLAGKEKVRFATANTLRVSPGFCRLKDYLQAENTETVHLIRTVCTSSGYPAGSTNRWLSDPQLAGGGVLLRNCYELIDEIVLNFGLPQQVYSVNTNHAVDKQQRLSITEDTAIVTMKFSDALIANIIAGRNFGPQQQQLTIYSKEKCLKVSKDRFDICDNPGNVISESEYEADEPTLTEKMLKNFANTVFEDDKKSHLSWIKADLNTMAVIESAYLSARTAMPEEPARILEMVNTEPRSILDF